MHTHYMMTTATTHTPTGGSTIILPGKARMRRRLGLSGGLGALLLALLVLQGPGSTAMAEYVLCVCFVTGLC